jgi:hypothetical protein
MLQGEDFEAICRMPDIFEATRRLDELSSEYGM